MENNIVEKKEGIYYYFKTLFGNTNREKDIDEIIEDDDKINEETKKEWERLQKRIKAMERHRDESGNAGYHPRPFRRRMGQPEAEWGKGREFVR